MKNPSNISLFLVIFNIYLSLSQEIENRLWGPYPFQRNRYRQLNFNQCSRSFLDQPVGDICRPHGRCVSRDFLAYCVCNIHYTGVVCNKRRPRHTRILMFGGDLPGVYHSTEVYFPHHHNDSHVATPLAEGRTGPSAGNVLGNVIVTGGFDPTTGKVLKSTEVYRPNKFSWVKGPDINEPRRYAASAVIDRSMYICGGDSGQNAAFGTNTCERLSYGRRKWNYIAPMLQQRTRAAGANLNDYFYVVGGYGNQRELATGERYNPRTNRWNGISAMRHSRSGLAMAEAHGFLFSCGGVEALWTYLMSCEKYDPSKDQWTEDVAIMDRGRSNFQLVNWNNLLYSFGGCCWYGFSRLPAAVYDPATNVWLPVPLLQRDRSSFAAVSY